MFNVSACVFVTSNESEAAIRCGHFWALGEFPQLSPQVETIKTVTYHYVLPVIIVFGIVGNLINVLILRYFTGKTFAYLFWLAVSDLAALTVATCWVYRVSSSPLSILDAYITCHILHEAVHMFCASSAFIVVTLTIIRFCAVCFPISSAFSAKNHSRTKLIIALCFAFAFILYVPMSFLYKIETIIFHNETSQTTICHVCKFSELNDHNFGRVYVTVRETISRIFPVIIVALLNICIIIALVRYQERRASLGCSSDRKKQAEEKRLMALLKAVMIIFLICTTPIAILQKTLVASQIDDFAYELFRAAANILVMLNTAMNFYLYCFYSAAIRQRLTFLFCRHFAITMNVPPNSISLERPTNHSIGQTHISPSTNSAYISHDEHEITAESP